MIILLLTLLAIALTMTFAGLLLSPKSHVSGQSQRRNSHVTRGSGVRRSSLVDRQVRTRRASMVIERRSGTNILTSVNIENMLGARMGKQTPWLGILLILLALFGFSAFSLRSVILNPGLIVSATWPDAAASPVAALNAPTQMFPETSGASKALARVSQLDMAQYASQKEYNTWAFSACSAAAMTEVINSYGNHYRITDILNVEARIGEITPDLGLVEPTGIDHTVARFGFRTITLNRPSLDSVIKVANQGTPIIVGFPPERWAGGHLLVLRGGNSQSVYLADSSRLNMQVMSHATFLKYWGGFAVGVLPK